MTIPVFTPTIGLAFPVTRTNLGFNVIKQDPISGAKRTRYPQRNAPQYQWGISFSILRSGTFIGSVYTELQNLVGFFNEVNGSAYPFSYKDDTDNAVTLQQFGIGDGVSKQFQLVRSFGGFVEPVYLATGTPSIYVNGVLKTLTTDYAISAAGVVTFTAAPEGAIALTWTGTYNWLCRFDVDKIDFNEFYAGMWKADKITFSNELLA